jgi:hypothetical protein
MLTVALGLVAFSAAVQAADLLLYSIPLPGTNDPTLSGAYLVPEGNPGDYFQLAVAPTVEMFSVWFVGTTTADNSTGAISGDNPTAEFGATGLYIGLDSGGTMTNVGGAPTYTAVTYPNGSNYQNTPGSYSQLYEATWTGLNLPLAAGLYDFAIATSGSAPYILASTCGDAFPCADGEFFGFTSPTNSTQGTAYSGGDLNVLITGTVPEPGTWLLICAGAGVLALSRGRRRG